MLLFTAAAAKSAYPLPIKIDVHPEKSSVKQGSSVEVRVSLRDANNSLAQSPKDLTIDVQTTDGVGAVHTDTLHFKAGEEAQTFRINASAAGVYRVLAAQSELLQGGAYVKVTARGKSPSTPPTRGPSVSSQSSGLTIRSGSEIPPTRLPIRPQEAAAHESTPPLTRQPLPAVPPPAMDPELPGLQLWTMPLRKLLADGKDSATIGAFLDSPAPKPIQIQFQLSDGKLAPAPLVIDAGQDTGQASLTADHVGTITVAFLGSYPKLPVTAGGKLTIVFAPVITQIHVAVSPPAISMFDQSNVIVTLLDGDAKPIQTDEDRHISLAFASGQGHLTATDLVIKAGQSEAKTVFSPTDKCTAIISASTLGMFSRQSTLQVTWPVLLLTLSLLGGVLGGIAAFLAVADAKWWRIALGPPVGLALYWGCIFIGLAHMLPSAVVLNPFSALVLGMLGGWLGTQVFALLLKALGLAQSKV